jgi:hypothetical protein
MFDQISPFVCKIIRTAQKYRAQGKYFFHYRWQKKCPAGQWLGANGGGLASNGQWVPVMPPPVVPARPKRDRLFSLPSRSTSEFGWDRVIADLKRFIADGGDDVPRLKTALATSEQLRAAGQSWPESA